VCVCVCGCIVGLLAVTTLGLLIYCSVCQAGRSGRNSRSLPMRWRWTRRYVLFKRPDGRSGVVGRDLSLIIGRRRRLRRRSCWRRTTKGHNLSRCAYEARQALLIHPHVSDDVIGVCSPPVPQVLWCTASGAYGQIWESACQKEGGGWGCC
jgi:hypothetical protein